MKPDKFNFFYGHRKPSQNRPIVHGGLFTNRQTLTPKPPENPSNSGQPEPPFDIEKWDPDSPAIFTTPLSKTPSHQFFAKAKPLSPIARYVCDSLRKNRYWGSEVVADLNKLRRVTPQVVAEVLKVQTDARISEKFFHWAGRQKGYKHNYAAYNAYAYCLNRLNKFRAADQVLELMRMQGKMPSEKQFEVLIRMHIDSNRGLRLYYVYEKMKKFGIQPRVFLYNRIMDGLVKTGHLGLALSVYEDFRENGLVEESVTFMILAKGLCKVGRVDETVDLLSKMRKKLCKPDVFAYTAMVKVLVSEGNLDGCLRVWEEMEKDGVEPDVMAYSTLIMGLCKADRVQKGYEFFREMKEKGYLIDRAIYGSLVEAFAADGKVGLAFDLLKDLMDSGYRADILIYNSLIKGLCDVNQVDKAYYLFRITVKEGLEPDFMTVNPLLQSYAELRRMEDFCNLLTQMQNLDFALIDDIAKFFSFMLGKDEKKIMLGLEVFKELKVKGYCSVPIYNILMEALHRIGEVKRALSLFNEMKETKLSPDSVTYSNAITCYVGIGDIQEACSCYNKIKQMNFVPSVVSYCSLVKGLCKIGEIDAAIMLVRDCLANVASGPVEFKYTLTILHLCKVGGYGKVTEVLNEMIEQGCRPDELVYSAIISGMCKHGTIEEARKVFADLRENGLLTEAGMIVYDELLSEHAKKKTADLVLLGLKFFNLEKKLKNKGFDLLPS